MKARVKETGKLLENVIPIMSVDDKVVMFHEYGTEDEYYYYEDLDFSNTIDWEQTRIQVAIAAMQGMIISDVYADIEISNQMTYEKSRKKWDNVKIAKAAVAHADALVAELQKKIGQDDNRRD